MNELARLKWQCRRGTKELDFLLNRYLEMEYSKADGSERALFEALLGIEDDELAGVLLGDRDAGEMGFLVEKIRFS
ncbi:succinate dehydrogenase assembly factor 2 [Candidatus Methylobacter oryzae]|uniref:FAD assembly factor SdhE n=1 Tax=Candidatus Methylobacter oryzae TaxID=2497749 RepID=A0ABY3CE45_9GAMM|nr:succinate dehydrogenase assembly factor 2 [Candidatus Methylobacter oryzae]TRX01145.1 succinate dehydrogenase assembly factor 2 [Candidatus Methylobacter oryzae]